MPKIIIHQEDYSIVRCPVGKELLEYRKPWEVVEAYCDDCNHTYRFEQYSSIPSKILRGRKSEHGCGCGACGR